MDELKAMKIWVCWNLTTDKKGRKTKTPCAASGGVTGTDAAHAHTWVTFAEAMMAAIENDYSGVGFIVPRGFFFLDVDHRTEDDLLVVTLLNRFSTYAEHSYSGSGLHLYGKCIYEHLPIEKDDRGRDRLAHQYYTKNPGNGLELYIGGLTNRFAVFTGNVVQEPIASDCTQAILATLEQNMKRESRSSESVSDSVDDRACQEIIHNLRADRGLSRILCKRQICVE